MPTGKASEPAKPETSKDEPEYTLTLIPYLPERAYSGYLAEDNLPPAQYRAVLRYGDEVIDDWRGVSRNEAEVDALWKKYAHQVKIGKITEEVITLGDDAV